MIVTGVGLPVPLDVVSLFADDRGQLVPFYQMSVDLLTHLLDLRLLASDLHLLDDHHQE